MRKIYFITILVLACICMQSRTARACYANFLHTNMSTGDTVWFYALDLNAVHFWDFGDMNSGPNMAFDDTAYHVYNTPGTYYVTHFVNVGAEWAYETQEITVNNISFEAAFEGHCNGNNYITFTNRSKGNNLSYLWNFGDPASGLNDTSTAFAPYHLFTASGPYMVTLIISDGMNLDTVSKMMNATSPCMSASYSYMSNTCMGDTTHFYTSYSNVTAVSWDFGDPATGPANYSTDMSPWHIYSGMGRYNVKLVYTDGSNYDTLYTTAFVTNCNVYPGDCNRDGIVSPEDLFAIGLNYGDTGSVRTGATMNFTEQTATDWHNNTPFLNMYLQDMVNKKHADCNGDGVLNSADAAAISQNFGMMHAPAFNIESSMQQVPANAPAFRLQVAGQVSPGAASASLQLGSMVNPCPYVYGYCVSIPYDPATIDATSISVDFAGSWLDSAAQNNLLNWYYNDVSTHTLHIASVRTNHMGVTGGYGTVAQINFDILPTAPGGNMDLNILPTAKLMSNAVFDAANGQVLRYLKANIENASTEVLAVHEVTKTTALTISPVPAKQVVHLSLAGNEKVNTISLINLSGQVLRAYSPSSNDIDVSALSNGIYWLKVCTAKGVYEQKIEVLH